MSVWTVDTLKEHFDVRLSDWQLRILDAKHATERAEDAARATREYTEQKNNEFRGQLADQARMFMPRAEADQRYATTTAALGDARSSTQRSLEEMRVTYERELGELRATTQKTIEELRTVTQKGTDELRRLVYIATGIALAAGVAIPLLLRVAPPAPAPVNVPAQSGSERTPR